MADEFWEFAAGDPVPVWLQRVDPPEAKLTFQEPCRVWMSPGGYYHVKRSRRNVAAITTDYKGDLSITGGGKGVLWDWDR